MIVMILMAGMVGMVGMLVDQMLFAPLGCAVPGGRGLAGR